MIFSKKIRKTIVSIAAVTSLFVTCSVYSLAANTGDTSFYVEWRYAPPKFNIIQNSSNSNFNNYVYRLKTNSSRVYFKNTSESYTKVRPCGVPSSCINKSTNVATFSKSDLTNCTYDPVNGTLASYAKCNQNINYSIASLIYEKGFSYCTLSLKSSSTTYGNGAGYWSPDSSYSHSAPSYGYDDTEV